MRVDESCQTLACIKRMMVPARIILSHTLKFTTQETIHRSRIQDWGLTFASTPQQVLCLGVLASQYTQTKNHNLPETTTSQFQVRRYSSCAALSDDSHSIVRRKFTGDGDSDLVVEYGFRCISIIESATRIYHPDIQANARRWQTRPAFQQVLAHVTYT